MAVDMGDTFKDAKGFVGYLRANTVTWESRQIYEHAR
jgi:hypothetical protein